MTFPAAAISPVYIRAVEVGGTKLQWVVATRKSVILPRPRFTVEKTRGAEGIRECMTAALSEPVKQWVTPGIAVGHDGSACAGSIFQGFTPSERQFGHNYRYSRFRPRTGDSRCSYERG